MKSNKRSISAKVAASKRDPNNRNNKLGSHLSEKAKIKIGLANKGKVHTAEQNEHQSIVMKGKHNSPLTEFIKGQNAGENSRDWKGDNVGYSGLHKWVRKVLGKPSCCESCGFTSLNSRKIHWANKSGKYNRDINDWMQLCVPCHSRYDRSRQSDNVFI